MDLTRPEASAFLDQWRRRRARSTAAAERAVRPILRALREEGDRALLAWARRLDGARLTAATVRVRPGEFAAARRAVPREAAAALRLAAARIEAFHRRALRESWLATEPGVTVGVLTRPLASVGVYVPGGKAAYPSSVLMMAIPAAVAGVPRVAMVTPVGRDGRVPPAVLLAAALTGVREVYKVGGPQAIAALAYGTAAVPKVEKIVGPGNLYVSAAKALVAGEVGIDMVAGPTEIVVVADGSASPPYVAADLLSQAEHDESASALLLTPSRPFAEAVAGALTAQLAALPRRAVAAASLARWGALCLTADLGQALEVANALAPEHLELCVAKPWAHLEAVRNAGAIFLGQYTPETLGDYVAGPSHVLPTGGRARFASPLSVEDFQKRSSVIAATAAGLRRLGRPAMALAALEGLQGHREAVRIRLQA
ncbi:MAG: histidinol dehydrogenase [candidate division NC10 bacterium]|nr:histidinol dehydrogenase [candidate division NC10 bacterium]